MAEETYITPELRSLIGKELWSAVYNVEKGAIRKFAEAIADPNPLWQDEEHAQKGRYGAIIAPPTFVTTFTLYGATTAPPVFLVTFALSGGAALASIQENFPLQRRLNGGNEIEFFHPIRAGDTITATARLADVYERTGGRGAKMVFFVIEKTCKNQRGEVVIISRDTAIVR